MGIASQVCSLHSAMQGPQQDNTEVSLHCTWPDKPSHGNIYCRCVTFPLGYYMSNPTYDCDSLREIGALTETPPSATHSNQSVLSIAPIHPPVTVSPVTTQPAKSAEEDNMNLLTFEARWNRTLINIVQPLGVKPDNCIICLVPRQKYMAVGVAADKGVTCETYIICKHAGEEIKLYLHEMGSLLVHIDKFYPIVSKNICLMDCILLSMINRNFAYMHHIWESDCPKPRNTHKELQLEPPVQDCPAAKAAEFFCVRVGSGRARLPFSYRTKCVQWM